MTAARYDHPHVEPHVSPIIPVLDRAEELQKVLDVWQTTAQRVHEDHQSALAIFKEVHAQVANLSATIPREVMERMEAKVQLAAFWRSIAMAFMGLMAGLLSIGVLVASHFNQIDTTLARVIERQDTNTLEIDAIRRKHDATIAADEERAKK